MSRTFFIALFIASCSVTPMRTAPPRSAALRSAIAIGPFPLPDPPSTGRAWEPPANAPSLRVEIVRALLAAGMADPRGCELREVQLYVGESLLGGGRAIRADAFVFPDDPRFGIAWNGMVYALSAVGPRVPQNAYVRRSRCRRSYGLFRDEEEASVSCPGGTTAMALLALSGRWDLARTIPVSASSMPDAQLGDASYWRGLAAHMRGDDGAALHALRIAARASSPGGMSMLHEHDPFPTVELLLVDQERRARSHVRAARPIPSHIGAPEAAILVEDLDQVAQPQLSQPGYPSLGADPIVRALARAGEVAIPPLIAELERNPPRLTRSVHYFRDFVPSRDPVTVRQIAARLVLQQLGLEWEDLEPSDPEAPFREPELARALVDFHARYGAGRESVTARLTDPRAALPMHLSALRWLERHHRFSPGQRGARWLERVEADPALLGAVRRRAPQLAASGHACEAARALAALDPDRAALRAIFRRCTAERAFCECTGAITIVLQESGDDVLARYAASVRSVPPPPSICAVLEPIARYPDHPEMQQLQRWIRESAPAIERCLAQQLDAAAAAPQHSPSGAIQRPTSPALPQQGPAVRTP